MTLLSINAGSSSLKVAVFDDAQPDEPRASLSVENIESFDDATKQVAQWLHAEQSVEPSDVQAIGYRIVHGGNRFADATIIDNDVVEYLQTITPLAPNHMPSTLACIQAFTRAYTEATHVGCFDTSFFHDVPDTAKVLPISKKLQDEIGMRRFGFHGLSYESLLDNFSRNEGPSAARGRVIMAHLGSGASVSACVDGKPRDMSMGFTPVSGIMMSSRSGDLEPGVVTYLQQEKNMSPKEVSELFSHNSGLLGVSGTTADMYTLLHSQESPDVALALELFCDKVRKQIAAFTSVLGGVDSIIFSGGIGERSAEIRARICSNLSFMGVDIDDTRNQANERLISSDASIVGVHVVPAQEDLAIIRHTQALLQKGAS
ncbi:acetate/propionate family kinase [Candidatus Saccharibacteria bacterium]|nr:acetate/propionate family kinase [Candidatus Saccharibacteria bacterium]